MTAARSFTVELSADQVEILDALAHGVGLDPAVLLVRAVGQGLSVMIADAEAPDPQDERDIAQPVDRSLMPRSVPGPDLDDGLPF